MHRRNPDNLRRVTICLIGFVGFLRYSKLATLKRIRLAHLPDHMEVFISQVKQINTGMVPEWL